jgi:hypothetical protein
MGTSYIFALQISTELLDVILLWKCFFLHSCTTTTDPLLRLLFGLLPINCYGNVNIIGSRETHTCNTTKETKYVTVGYVPGNSAAIPLFSVLERILLHFAWCLGSTRKAVTGHRDY